MGILDVHLLQGTRTNMMPVGSDVIAGKQIAVKGHSHESDSSTKVCIVCDDTMEAVSGAMILRHFLIPYVYNEDLGSAARNPTRTPST
eukprot:2552076-Amphidinium_carterae.1